jgi:hypothetical protein
VRETETKSDTAKERNTGILELRSRMTAFEPENAQREDCAGRETVGAGQRKRIPFGNDKQRDTHKQIPYCNDKPGNNKQKDKHKAEADSLRE